MYFRPAQGDDGAVTGAAVPLRLVELTRARLKQWRDDGYPGASRTTLELLKYWRRDGRLHRLFFAQLEAAETIVFLNEARRDYLQGIEHEKPLEVLLCRLLGVVRYDVPGDLVGGEVVLNREQVRVRLPDQARWSAALIQHPAFGVYVRKN